MFSNIHLLRSTSQSHLRYDSHGIFSAPRALYTFRAFGHKNSSVLDGGLPGWEAANLAVDSSPSSIVPEKTTYPEPSLDTEVVKSESRK